MVRFFGANDKYTLDQAIEFLELQRSKEMNHAATLKQKANREKAYYAGMVLSEIIEEFKTVRDNGPTPAFILEKLRINPAVTINKPVKDFDAIEESIAPGGRLRIEDAQPHSDGGDYAFINWLADHYSKVIEVQEIVRGEFGIAQFVLEPDMIRRVVLASVADRVIVRTRHNGGTLTHSFERGAWLKNTAEPNERVDTDILTRLGLTGVVTR